jgi:hypothetical protein
VSSYIAPRPNKLRFQFQKRSQPFIRVHNEALAVAAMRVNNPQRFTSRDQGLIRSHNSSASLLYSSMYLAWLHAGELGVFVYQLGFGRTCGVERGLGVGEHLPVHGVGVGVGVGDAVGVGVAVVVAVAVAVAVGKAVGV